MGPENDDLIGIWKYALDRIDKQLEIELNLISARMSWLVISESFLFNAFVGAGGDYIKPPGVGMAIQLVVAVMGFLIARFVNSAVSAALEVIDQRQVERGPMEQRLLVLMKAADKAIALPSVSREDKRNQNGSIPAQRIPSLLMLGWVILVAAWTCRFAWLHGIGAFKP
jgi:hypothetical protein